MNELKIPTNLETISLNEQTNYRLIEIGDIKDYLEQEIKYQQLLTSKLSKYLTGFDYANKILTVVLTVFSGTKIFARVKTDKQLVGLITSIFSIKFFIFRKNYKTTTRKKTRKKKHNKLLHLAKNKLDCVEIKQT